VPVPTALGVYVTKQLPELREQLAERGVNEPVPLLVKLTDPVGGIAVPGLVASDTVTVHFVFEPTATEVGVQVTSVELARFVTVIVKMSVLDVCSEVPLYDPLIL
jgi:hypothetical protein